MLAKVFFRFLNVSSSSVGVTLVPPIGGGTPLGGAVVALPVGAPDFVGVLWLLKFPGCFPEVDVGVVLLGVLFGVCGADPANELAREPAADAGADCMAGAGLGICCICKPGLDIDPDILLPGALLPPLGGGPPLLGLLWWIFAPPLVGKGGNLLWGIWVGGKRFMAGWGVGLPEDCCWAGGGLLFR